MPTLVESGEPAFFCHCFAKTCFRDAARYVVNLRIHGNVPAADTSLLELLDVAIASVAPLNEVWCILGPPHEHPSGQRLVFGKPHDGLRDLINRQQSRRNAALDTLGGR